MLTRRELLKQAGFATALAAAAPAMARGAEADGTELNDVQSQLNATRVRRVVRPKSLDDLQAALRTAKEEGSAISMAGGRHAMGGQQFADDAIHLDTTSLSRVLSFDRERGLIELEAGIQWPELLAYLHGEQEGDAGTWTIRQKQTGVDAVTLGGTLAANAHARGLRFKPIIDDVEAIDLLDAEGKLHTCSRRENAELFRLAIGGYGLFGVVAGVKLRLARRRKLQRVVKVMPLKDLVGAVEERVRAGFLYGDCQFSTDLGGSEADHPGIFSCYRPVDDETPVPEPRAVMTKEDWARLYLLARTDKRRAFETYADYYRSTDGHIYWSDLNQLAGTFDVRNLQEALARETGAREKGTEMITEVYVSPDELIPFLRGARKEVLDRKIDLTYGTIRFIERDDESFLAWAKDRAMCILCNIHIKHTREGLAKAADDLRALIGRAIRHGGRYYLTYHRWATREQVTAAYPQFVEFLRLKQKYDPHERFQSNWYRHYREMFADKLWRG